MTIYEDFDHAWVEDSRGCRVWQRARAGKEASNGGGYGCLKHKGKLLRAHCVAWEREFGPIPDGMHVRHLCHNTLCVNPYHMALGTNYDNAQDKLRAGRYPSKLSKEDAQAIKRRYANGEKQRVIAVDYGIAQADVSNIVNGKYWRHA